MVVVPASSVGAAALVGKTGLGLIRWGLVGVEGGATVMQAEELRSPELLP